MSCKLSGGCVEKTWNTGEDNVTTKRYLNPRPSEYETVLDYDVHLVLVLHVYCEEISY
jgi:hypothetical protein